MKRLGLTLLSLALVIAMSACAARTPATPTPGPASPVPTPYPGTTGNEPGGNGVEPAQTAPVVAMTPAQSTELSQKANEAAGKISEVDACVTAIIGDTCVAGVTFDTLYKGALTDRIRDMVASRIQSAAPDVARVAVTSDPSITAQVQSLAEKIKKAGALADLTGELDGLLAQIH